MTSAMGWGRGLRNLPCGQTVLIGFVKCGQGGGRGPNIQKISDVTCDGPQTIQLRRCNHSFLQVGRANLHTAAQRLRPKTAANIHAATGPSSLKFLVVRHPFERIASAYVDKFEIGKQSDYIFKTFNK